MSDTTPNGTVPDIISDSSITPSGTTDESNKIASLEKQLSDRTSYYGKQLSAQEQLLKKEYSEDPSKIHSIEDSELRTKLTKLVFPELAQSKDPYEDARLG